MPATDFDESLVQQSTPWAACAALEGFFDSGGVCRLNDGINWIGIAFTCARKAHGDSPESAQLVQMLGWGHLAVSVRESLAARLPSSEAWGIIKGAMWVRVSLILQCGNHPGDNLCDCDKVVRWCFSTPQVKQFLEATDASAPELPAPEVREVANILESLITDAALKDQRAIELVAAVGDTQRKK